MQIINNKKERVIAYIDGFNLYFGMKDAGFHSCKWLNVKSLVESLLLPTQELIDVKYFTSRVRQNPDKQKRQSTYIDALETLGIGIIYGHYQDSVTECLSCGRKWNSANEKKTDVNIATSMVVDAFHDKFDTAMLISGDSDLIPPIEVIHLNFETKKVFIAFPPKRHNRSMSIISKGSLIIGRKKLIDAQFPEEVIGVTGFKLTVPNEWK
jgi:uncharacterized LabA/DUF88 family protein